MRNRLRKRGESKRGAGFTLIELLIVLIIIGVLASLAIPRYEGARARARWAEVERICGQVANANYAYHHETGRWFAGTADVVANYMSLPTVDGIAWIAYEHTATGERLGWFYGLRPGVSPPRYLGMLVYPNGSKEKVVEGGVPDQW